MYNHYFYGCSYNPLISVQYPGHTLVIKGRSSGKIYKSQDLYPNDQVIVPWEDEEYVDVTMLPHNITIPIQIAYALPSLFLEATYFLNTNRASLLPPSLQ